MNFGSHQRHDQGGPRTTCASRCSKSRIAHCDRNNATSKGLAAGRDRSGDTSIAPRPLPHWTTAHDTSSHSLFATGGRRRPPSQVCRPVAPKVPSAPPHRFPSRGRAPDHGLTKCGQSLGQGLGAKCLRPPSSVIEEVGAPVRGVEARGVTHGLEPTLKQLGAHRASCTAPHGCIVQFPSPFPSLSRRPHSTSGRARLGCGRREDSVARSTPDPSVIASPSSMKKIVCVVPPSCFKPM